MSIEWNRDGTVKHSRCDVCQVAALPGTHDTAWDKDVLESHGWRWQEREPLDTCPSCLAREKVGDQ